MSSKEAILIVLDVGPGVGMDLDSAGHSFMEKSKLCASMIIQRKIFSEAKDELGLILVGSENTNNPLADGNSYEHVEIISSLQIPNWSMVHKIADYENHSSVDGDWLDALVVAVDFMKTCTDGPHVYRHLTKDGMAEAMSGQMGGQKLIASIVSETDGVICSFDDALPQLIYFERKKVRPVPWKVVLDVGSQLKIPVNGYKKIDPVVKKPKTQDFVIPPRRRESTKEEPTPVLQTAPIPLQDKNIPPPLEESFVRVEKDKVYTTSGDDPGPVDAADLIMGYKFGSTVVPVSDVDRQTLVYESGPACLSVLGFTPSSNISRHYLVGKGCIYIVPENEPNSIRAFSALLQAMHNAEMVAVVRRVSRNHANPSIGALYPKIREKYQCMVLIELPYSEAMPSVVFPPIVKENNRPSTEQLEVVDQLIQNMDLMTADVGDDGEVSEAFRPKKSLDPAVQHFYHTIAQKILSKHDSDVTNLHESVKALLDPPSTLVEKTQCTIKRIEELFPLTEIKPKEGKRIAAADIFNLDVSKVNKASNDLTPVSSIKSETSKIGTVQPVSDFLNLIAQGTAFMDACFMMQTVIFDLVSHTFDAEDLLKPLEAVVALRKECSEIKPSIYNSWIAKLKKELPVGKKAFWQLIIRDRLGLISTSESKLSDVSPEEAEQFLKEEEEEFDTQQAQNDDGLDDLIGLM